MKGKDHEPDIDGDTSTDLAVGPKILSNMPLINIARLQPLQSGVFPYPANSKLTMKTIQPAFYVA